MLSALLAALASLLIAGLTWRRSGTPGLRPFRALCLCSAGWSLVRLLELSAGHPLLAALDAMHQAWTVATPLAWLAFALAYAGLVRSVQPRTVFLLLGPAVGALALAAWRPALGERAVASYGHVLAIAGAVIALSSLTRPPRRGGRVAGIVAACSLVLGASALAIFEPDLLPGIAPQPTGFAAAAVVLGVSLFRRRLLDLAPVARSLVVEDLPDGVIVLDDQDRVVDCNTAAEALLGQPVAALLGSAAARVLPPALSERLGAG
ncbi:MAG TPA: histidine kinase N-terminal 7TM domain-containing protein, partial [Vicinamibacteria bacterium]